MERKIDTVDMMISAISTVTGCDEGRAKTKDEALNLPVNLRY